MAGVEARMHEFDVVIVGAGLCGAIAATMLSRAGHSVAIVDPNRTYPDDFRVEKFDGEQLGVLEKTGLSDTVIAASTHDRFLWVSLLGHLAEKRASDQLGFDYGALVNTLRAEIPPAVTQIHAKATAIANSPDRQRVSLSNGETIEAKLVVLASGLNNGLRDSLGMERVDLVRCQSITFGFDMEPAEASSFPFRALTHYSEHPRFRTAYITLFPIGTRMRANFFVYRDLHDPWLRTFRDAPEATLEAVMPRLERLTGPFRIVGPVKMRPIDLYATKDYLKPGVVLVGDAFGTGCPAAGTGARKALVDVERLCNGYVSRWLSTPGMGVDKIASFYADPEKVASDCKALELAYRTKAMSIAPGLGWWVRRWAQLALTRVRWARNDAKAALSGLIHKHGEALDLPARSPDPRA
jgi:2-polyprenyl-6-methoxyphenol hydroxylase-like FAD-dependent oxidoreductase